MKKIAVLLIILLFALSSCIKIGGPSEPVQPIVNLNGIWTGFSTETLTFGACEVLSSGRLTATFIVTGNSFTGTFLSAGSGVSKDRSCGGGEYNNIGTISGTFTGQEITGTISFIEEGAELKLPFFATISDKYMLGSYAGQGLEDGVTSFYEGDFNLERK